MGVRAVGGLSVAAALVAAAFPAPADGLHARTERVLRDLAKAAATHAAERGAKGDLPKDNSLCLLCHAKFREEPLVTSHQKQRITCAACHGLSYEHMNDETSRTKPDLLYGRAQVAGFCRRCHRAHAHPAKVAAFLVEWKGKRRPNGRLILLRAICTDCHGTHVLHPMTAVRAH